MHEIITGKIIRLSFDIDTDCDIEYYQERIINEVSAYGIVPNLITLKSTGDKKAWHVYTDISCTLKFA